MADVVAVGVAVVVVAVVAVVVVVVDAAESAFAVSAMLNVAIHVYKRRCLQ